MAAKWIELVTGSLEQKKQYRQYKARIEALPEPYGTAAKALERYFMYYGGVTDGETAVKMLGDFADLWERAAADGTPVGAIVGDDPVEFADTFAQAYTGKRWIDKERARLTKAIEDAERADHQPVELVELLQLCPVPAAAEHVQLRPADELERDQRAVEPSHEDAPVGEGHAAVVDAAAGDVAGPGAVDLGIELPAERALLAAGHVEGHHVDEAVAADAAAHLDRRKLRQVLRQALELLAQ